MNKNFWEVCGDHPVLTFFVISTLVTGAVDIVKSCFKGINDTINTVKGIKDAINSNEANKNA